MRILFVHQNMPGQFKHLAPQLAARGHEVSFITRKAEGSAKGVRRLVYEPAREVAPSTHHYLIQMESAVLNGQAVARLALKLEADQERPDVIVAHPGWGETLYLKDVWPRVPLLHYCEFYYRAHGLDVNFDPGDPFTFDETCRLRTRNAHQLLSLEACDRGISPTEWQRRTHPEPYRGKIETIFDGIDTDRLKPDPTARFALPDGRVLTAEDEIVTYVSRNLEPYRGFHSFIRALPALLAKRPAAQIVIAGGDDVSYGRRAPAGRNWREHMLAEVPLDPQRVHFTGTLPYDRYLDLLRISSLHLYLTVPFVLSWSMVEAMSTGCLILGSSTPPVEEFLEDGSNGVTVDMLDPAAIAARAAEMLAAGSKLDPLRRAARETVLERCALARCLPRQLALVTGMAG
ncbi:MAG TPA: glycosyltransferase family 4 protein [Aliidongia sp.]|nr:glycosyltransferase family 4 protein [Aliidongia sp.]